MLHKISLFLKNNTSLYKQKFIKMSKENLERMKKIIKAFSGVKVYLAVPNPKSQNLEEIKIKDINRLVHDQNRVKLVD